MDSAGNRPPHSRLAAALRRRAADYVAAGALLRPRERALLMLSGGADSMALLDIVRAVDRRLGLGLELSALHVDYATRGAASARDRHIVEDACRALAVPLHVVRLDRKPAGAGFQERAREIRYDAARAIAGRGEADVVVTAHNRDDQAETVLYRLAKYAAPSSLRAMRPREGDLTRPLLCLGAVELREYCRELGIAYGRDESNETVDYQRNLVRHNVLPVLAAINPRVAETLADAAALADQEHAVIVAALDEAWARVARPVTGAPGEPSWALDTSALGAEPAALRALCLRRLAHAALGDEALVGRRLTQRLEQLAAGAAGSRSVSLGGGYEAVAIRPAHGPAAGGHACVPARRPRARFVDCLLRSALPRRPRRRLRVRRNDRRGLARRRATRWTDRVASSAPRRPPAPVRHGCRRVAQRPVRGRPGAARPTAVAVVAELDGRLAWVCPGRSSEWFRVTPETPYTLHIFEEATEAT